MKRCPLSEHDIKSIECISCKHLIFTPAKEDLNYSILRCDMMVENR